MAENTLIGYHATKYKNINLILSNGFLESEPTQGHWLGKGTYFFENLYYAVEWEIIGVIKHNIDDYNQLIKKCGIIKAKIDTEHYKVIDISTPQGYVFFEYLLKVIKENYPEEKYKYILNKGAAYIIKIMEQLEIKKNEKYLSDFDVVCADYPKKITQRKQNLPGDFIACVQKQICVKNKNAIKKIEHMEHNETTEIMFDLIKKNRGIKND